MNMMVLLQFWALYFAAFVIGTLFGVYIIKWSKTKKQKATKEEPEVKMVGFSSVDGNEYFDFEANGQVVFHILKLARNERAVPFFWANYPL